MLGVGLCPLAVRTDQRRINSQLLGQPSHRHRRRICHPVRHEPQPRQRAQRHRAGSGPRSRSIATTPRNQSASARPCWPPTPSPASARSTTRSDLQVPTRAARSENLQPPAASLRFAVAIAVSGRRAGRLVARPRRRRSVENSAGQAVRCQPRNRPRLPAGRDRHGVSCEVSGFAHETERLSVG